MRLVFGCVAAIYVLGFPYHPRLRSPNELSRLWQARAVVDHGTLELNRTLAEHGSVGDLSVMGGRYYPSKAPLLSLAAVPVVAALEAVSRLRGLPAQNLDEVTLVFWSRLFLTVLPALAILVWLRRFLSAYLDPKIAVGLVVTYAVGTMALCFAQMFIGHQLTAVLLFSSFFALWKSRRGEWRGGAELLAGVFAGAALACEYTAVIGVVGLAVYAFCSARSVRESATTSVRAVLGALPFILGILAYHQACFGHPLESGYRHLNDAGYQPWHLGGFLGIRIPDGRALLLSLFSPLRGLFVLSPFLILAPFGFAELKRRDRALFYSTAVMGLLYLYFTASFSYDSWGWTPGPRHLTPWLPFLMLPTGLVLQRVQGFARGAAVGLCAVSIAMTAMTAQLNYIPDDVSTALFGLVFPLFRDGFWVPNLASLWGLNPLGGIALLLTAFTAAASAAWALAPVGPARSVGAGLALAVVVPLCLLISVPGKAPNDGNALRLLEASWLVSRPFVR